MYDETFVVEGHMSYLFRSEHNVMFHLRNRQVFWKATPCRWAIPPCCSKERTVFIVHCLSLKVKALQYLEISRRTRPMTQRHFREHLNLLFRITIWLPC